MKYVQPKISLTDLKLREDYEGWCDDILCEAFDSAKVEVNDRRVDITGNDDNIPITDKLMVLMDKYAHSAWRDICKENGAQTKCNYCDDRFECWTS